MAARRIDIRPGVSILSVLRHLNYQPWFALAEFVDNSVESYSQHKITLQTLHGNDFKLSVKIDIESRSPTRISIRDNAAGIALTDFGRAFRPAAIPPDRSGLAEFGMGMKSAACWFASNWSVRTSALDEPVSRTVHFDIENIVNDEIEELEIKEESEEPTHHYTEIVLDNIHHVPVGRTVGKLKEHLADIFRVFIRNGSLDLTLNGEELIPENPAILNAQYFLDQNGPKKLWRKEIDFDFGLGMSVRGFAALRETGNTAKAGFSLFRRDRVIEGSGDEGYRPTTVFGRSNSYCYQRLFGELHLSGFEVSHTKDGFRWDENEETFLDLLKEHLDSKDLPLLKQAQGYRVRIARSQLKRNAKQAVENTARAIERHIPAVLPSILAASPVDAPEVIPPRVGTLARKQFDIRFRDKQWRINIELTEDLAESQWLVFSDALTTKDNPRKLDLRVSMVHPFMVRFAQSDSENVEALLRIAAALVLAEVLARESGVRKVGTVRRNINEILRQALSEP